MDERDFWIMSQIRKDPFLSYENLGRGIGLSGKAVKTRIETLEKDGILTSLHAMPVARVFHRFPRLYFFEKPSASTEILDAALTIDPAIFATRDVNGKVVMLVYDLLTSPKLPQELVTLLGQVESEATPLFPHPVRDRSKPLSFAELKVLRMLVLDLRVPLKEISEIADLSQKVAKKIRRQLLEDGFFQVQPIFQSAQSSHILMYEVHVYSHDNTVLAKISLILPKAVFLNQWESTAVIFSCWANSMSEVYETEQRLKGEPGVTGVLVKFHTKALLSTSRLISWLDEEILQSQKEKAR